MSDTRVFKVKTDFRFQSFLPYRPDDPKASELVKAEILMGEGTARSQVWNPTPLFIYRPESERANITRLLGFGGYVLDERAYSLLLPILKDTCEFLPFLPLDGENFHWMNVMATVDCLDADNTQLRGDQSPEIAEIQVYQFRPDSFADATLFRVLEDEELFALSRSNLQDKSFKSIVEIEGLTGLKFEEVWSDGGAPIVTKNFMDKLKGR